MIRIGTDCSGIEAPIQALEQLKIPFKHVFCSEIDKYCIQSIKANYNQDIIFGDKDGLYPEGDITKRNINDVPDIDLYVCGFPCQPFSQAGDRKGFIDKKGNVFFGCLKVIQEKTPKIFILENVKGLLSNNKKKTFTKILNELEDLKIYNIYHKVLNTKDYGIPQNRERIYIIGIKKSEKFVFEWPIHIQSIQSLSIFIDKTDNSIDKIPPKILKYKFPHTTSNAIFINVDFLKYSKFPTANKICPCLMAVGVLWCIPKKRYANIKEWLLLQGFLKDFKQVVSKTQMKKQIGNSMSVNVLKNIIINLNKIFN